MIFYITRQGDMMVMEDEPLNFEKWLYAMRSYRVNVHKPYMDIGYIIQMSMTHKMNVSFHIEN